MVEIFLLVFCFVAYWPTLFYGLVVDDIERYEYAKAGFIEKGHPLKTILNYLYGGGTVTNTIVDHGLTILMTATTGILIYQVFGGDGVSLMAAVFYILNPINNQTTIWLNGRRYAVNVIIVLAMMKFTPWGFLLYPFTALFQINAIFSPLLALNTPFWWIVFFMPVFLVLGFRKIKDWFEARGSKEPKTELVAVHPRKIFLLVKTIGFYGVKMVVPGTCQFYYPFLNGLGMTDEGNSRAYTVDRHFVAGTAILALLGGIVAAVPQFAGYVLFIFASLAQWGNIVTYTQAAADRYASLPNVFVMVILAFFIGILEPFSAEIFVAFAVYYWCGLRQVMRQYKDLEHFYDYNIYHWPAGVSARGFKAVAQMGNKDYLCAMDTVLQGLRYEPKDANLLFKAAMCAYRLGDYQMAKKYLDDSMKNVYHGQYDRFKPMADILEEKIQKKIIREDT